LPATTQLIWQEGWQVLRYDRTLPRKKAKDLQHRPLVSQRRFFRSRKRFACAGHHLQRKTRITVNARVGDQQLDRKYLQACANGMRAGIEIDSALVAQPVGAAGRKSRCRAD
jgi:hypothetical protein